MLLLETTVDDLDPRVWPAVVEDLLAAGAADAWITPVLMKKGRPGHVLSVLAPPAAAPALRTAVLEGTSALGVRQHAVTRELLDRCWVDVQVGGAPVPVKVGHRDRVVVHVAVEYIAWGVRAHLDGISLGRIATDLYKVEAEVRRLVIATLADPAHASQIARTSAMLAAAQARLDTARNDAVELAKRLGEGLPSLTAYDAACAPMNEHIAKLTAEVEALREAGGGTAARQATIEEITAEWDGGDVDTRRALIRRVAPRGLVLLVPPDGRQAHTIPARDRIAVVRFSADAALTPFPVCPGGGAASCSGARRSGGL